MNESAQTTLLTLKIEHRNFIRPYYSSRSITEREVRCRKSLVVYFAMQAITFSWIFDVALHRKKANNGNHSLITGRAVIFQYSNIVLLGLTRRWFGFIHWLHFLR